MDKISEVVLLVNARSCCFLWLLNSCCDEISRGRSTEDITILEAIAVLWWVLPI